MSKNSRRCSSRPTVIAGLAVTTCLVLLPPPCRAEDPLSARERSLVEAGRLPEVWVAPLPATRDSNGALVPGLRLLDAQPPNGILVLPETEEAARTLADRGARPLRLRDKLAADLLPLAEGREQAAEPLALRAVTFRGRTPEAAGRELRRLTAPGERPLAVVDAAGRGLLWLRVDGERAAAALRNLAAHPDIQWIERSVPLEFKNDNTSWLLQSADEQRGRTVWQRGLTGFGQIVGVADSGLDADGCQFRYGADRAEVTTAIAFPQPPAAAIDQPGHKVITYYVVGSADAYDDGTGGYHGTHTTGDMAGDNYAHVATADVAGHDSQDGMAPGAQIVFQDIGADDGSLSGLQGVSMYDLLLQSYDTGARIHNNSYGMSMIFVGYDTDSASIDEACWRLNDLLVVFAAGNSGADQDNNPVPKSLGGTGSTAKNTLVVGASGPVELDIYGSVYDLREDLLFFSSQGPTSDSRLKPDVVAPGMVFSATADRHTAIDLGCCDVYGDPKRASDNEDDNCNVDQEWPAFGTSFSAPVTAGAATLVRQYFTDGFYPNGVREPQRGFNPSNALLKACLLSGARALTGEIVGMGSPSPLTPPPSFEQGWGRVNLEDALFFPDDALRTLVLADVPNPLADNPMLATEAALPAFSDGTLALATGERHSWHLPAVREEGGLRIFLTWSDPAAAPGAVLTLVNDLDLEVLSPGGDLYVGNREFAGGYSQPTWSAHRDQNNNVEGVIVEHAAAGSWQVEAIASSVPGNGQPGSDRQGFSLVANGDFAAPLPVAISPDRIEPGETLQNVQVTGRFFVTGTTLDLGVGLVAEDVEVQDESSLRIGRLHAADDAALGRRDVSAWIEGFDFLVGTGQGLLSVGGPASCGCSAGGGSPTVVLLGFLLLFTRRRGS